jgi:hypothetical protein
MIAQFALRLICGMSLMWALMPRRQVTSGFFRIQMLVVLGLGVLVALAAKMGRFDGSMASDSSDVMCLSQQSAAVVGGLVGGAAFVGSALWTLERRIAGERVGFIILAASGIALTFTNLRQMSWDQWPAWLAPMSQLAGAAVLGATMVGMLLGHWYLTTPTMSIDPLKRLNRLVCLAGIARLTMSAVVLTLGLTGQVLQDGTSMFTTTSLIFLSVRWVAGVLGPLVVSWMVWRILRYRNTQAATGVLFVGVILAFMGDMFAALLLRETGLPL